MCVFIYICVSNTKQIFTNHTFRPHRPHLLLRFHGSESGEEIFPGAEPSTQQPTSAFEKKNTQTELEIVLICSDNLYIWANYTNSLTWNKAIWEWFPVLTMISRSQWGRYNLHRYIIVYIYMCWFRCLMLLNDAYNGYLGYFKKARAVSAQEHQAVPRPAAVGDFGVPLQILWCIFRGFHGKFRPFWDSIGKYWFVGGFTGIHRDSMGKSMENIGMLGKSWGNLGGFIGILVILEKQKWCQIQCIEEFQLMASLAKLSKLNVNCCSLLYLFG